MLRLYRKGKGVGGTGCEIRRLVSRRGGPGGRDQYRGLPYDVLSNLLNRLTDGGGVCHRQ